MSHNVPTKGWSEANPGGHQLQLQEGSYKQYGGHISLVDCYAHSSGGAISAVVFVQITSSYLRKRIKQMGRVWCLGLELPWMVGWAGGEHFSLRKCAPCNRIRAVNPKCLDVSWFHATFS